MADEETRIEDRDEGLLSASDASQQRLLDIIARPYLENSRWPIFGYVEKVLATGVPALDARQVVASLPAVRLSGGIYRAIWTSEGSGATSFSPGATVGLTLLGRRQLPPLAGVGLELAAIRLLSKLYRDSRPDPYDASDQVVGSAELIEHLARERFPAHPGDGEHLRSTLQHEPPTWGLLSGAEGTAWSVYLRRRLRGFEDLIGLEDYVQSLPVLLQADPLPSPSAPSAPSPRTLPAALDYFNAVWQLRTQEPSLLRLPGAERTTMLVLNAATNSELSERLGALGEVLKGLQVPGSAGVSGHPIERLRAWFDGRADPADKADVDRALDLLENVVHMRNGLHHAEPRVPLPEACRRLGVPWPILDAGTAWSIVQGQTADAFDVLRLALP